VSEGRDGYARVENAIATILARLSHMFRLDEDLTPFYVGARDDPHLAWAATGACRMLRSPSVFEDVVKTKCTSATLTPGRPNLPGS
jgi:3-methyladenine DNA glycosylase/8-oxoguanine DNA glycosylase